MKPQNRPGAPRRDSARVDTGPARQGPQRAVRRCQAPGCNRAHKARGLCKKHYERQRRAGHAHLRPTLTPRRTLLGGFSDDRSTPTSSALTLFPHRPKRVTDALHALAESNPTPTEYERRKAEILRTT